jgi:hypothetical protein
MRPFLVEAPDGDVVPVDDALRTQCRIDGTDHDAALQGYVLAAVAMFDGYQGRLGRCILRQKWALPFTAGTLAVSLPFPDCRGFAIEYKDGGDAWQVLGGPVFEPGFDCVGISDVPDHDGPLYLTFFDGWDTADDVPENLKQAIRQLVALWHGAPAAATDQKMHDLPFGVAALVSPLVHIP